MFPRLWSTIDAILFHDCSCQSSSSTFSGIRPSKPRTDQLKATASLPAGFGGRRKLFLVYPSQSQFILRTERGKKLRQADARENLASRDFPNFVAVFSSHFPAVEMYVYAYAYFAFPPENETLSENYGVKVTERTTRATDSQEREVDTEPHHKNITLALSLLIPDHPSKAMNVSEEGRTKKGRRRRKGRQKKPLKRRRRGKGAE